jgi:hypothetical protein
MPILEANSGAVNVTVLRTALGKGSHRIYNKGVPESASQTDVIYDYTTMLADWGIVDEDLAKQGGNVKMLRHTEAIAKINAMGQQQAQMLIYGNRNHNPEAINGLATRLNKLEKDSVISMGGPNQASTSIFLVAAGPSFTHLIYPRGSASVGVEMRDHGLTTHKDKDGNEFPAFKAYVKSNYGIAVKEPRSAKRICNIPANVSGDDLVDAIMDLSFEFPTGAGNYVLYANSKIMAKLWKAARDKSNVVYHTTDPWGKPVAVIGNFRCRRVDAILNTEEQIV